MMTSNISNPLRNLTLRVVLYAGLLAALTSAVMMLLQNDPQRVVFDEGQLVEWIQFALLMSGTLILVWAGTRCRNHRTLTFSLAVFFAVAGIRECDSLLDHGLFDNAWKLLVAMVLIPSVAVVAPRRRALADSLRVFLQWHSFGIMLSGALMVFVVSRILGHNDFWKEIMGKEYLRLVPKVVEEITEMIGYFLLLIATVEYVISLHFIKNR